MYVIFPASDVVEESYYALVAQESADVNPAAELIADPVYHDTSEEAAKAVRLVRSSFGYELLGEDKREKVQQKNFNTYRGRVNAVIKMSASSGAAAAVAAGAPGGTSPQLALGVGMTTMEISAPGNSRLLVRDLIHPSLIEPLRNQQQNTFKLVKTMSDFTHDLSKIHEQHSDDLQNLVEEYRRRNGEFRGDRVSDSSNSLLSLWDSLLQEVEIDSQVHADIAGVFLRAISRPLLEKTFHMKIQSRKVFTHRESFESILGKTEEMLMKCHDEYSKSAEYQQQDSSPSANINLIESHNNYVQQLHACNGMIDQYYKETLPQLLQELDDVYHDVSAVIEEAFAQGTDVISMKSVESSRRYEGITLLCKNIKASSDLNAFVKTLNIPEFMTITKHSYSTPSQIPADPSQPFPALFRDEIHVDRVSQASVRNRFESLRKESAELEVQNRQLNDALETLVRIQARSLENQLFNKANELQEDISLKRFDLRVAHLHLAAIKYQKELFASKCDAPIGGSSVLGSNTPPSSSSGSTAAVNSELLLKERKLSSSSGGTAGGSSGGMKSKWVKAFKSIKGTSGKEPQERQKTGPGSSQFMGEANHIFQEYTYKKITPCDVCSQILRGHTRQGLKCKLCRLNIHPDCQDKAIKCQPKTRLLRRQKSASELDPRLGNPVDEDIARKLEHRSPLEIPEDSLAKYEGRQQEIVISRAPTLDYGNNPPHGSYRSSRYHSGAANTLSISGSANSYVPSSAPSSPVHSRRPGQPRLATTTRMSSVELPDENEKSVSSASTSPCPSPKPHRYMSANLYVVLYNFKPRHADELDLKAGHMLSVLDTSDKDWWKGKCLGSIGFFPSSYVSKLLPGEKPFQVQQTIQISSTDGSLLKLLRDQIVIRITEESYHRDGTVLIRTSENKQGHCSIQYLQEV